MMTMTRIIVSILLLAFVAALDYSPTGRSGFYQLPRITVVNNDVTLFFIFVLI